MPLYISKNNNFLGEAPVNKSENDLLDYFLYAFEFTWVFPAFEQYHSNIKEHFKLATEAILSKNPGLSVQKQWWGLVLTALKDIAEFEEFHYSKELINSLLNSIATLSEDELKEYINEINYSYLDETPDVLSLRPLVMENLKSDAVWKNDALKYFIENKDKFTNLFAKRLLQKKVITNYLNAILLNDKKVDMKFTNFWNNYYEIFVNYFLSIYDFFTQPEENAKLKSNTDVRNLINRTNVIFFVASVLNKTKVDSLNNEVTELLMPFIMKEMEC